MPKFAHSDVLDNGPAYIKANANKLYLLSTYAFGDVWATVAANKVCEVAMTTTDYTLATSGNNRTLTSASGKSAAATGSTNQYDAGTATGGSATTLVDSAKAWTTNVHANRAVTITGGTGAGQVGRIVSNTGTTLTFAAGTFSPAPDATSTYKILDDVHLAFVDTVNSKVLWATDETTNQAISSGNTVNFPSLVYTAQQPT